MNSYITTQLSFLPERESRCTRIVARSFSPEFEHYMEMSCDLLLQRTTGETLSLAEQLEEASATFTVWNKESRKGMTRIYNKITITSNCLSLIHFCALKGVEASQPKVTQLGTVKVPLADLIYKRTGNNYLA